MSRRVFHDISGQDFGAWHVVQYAGRKHGKDHWSCRCKCGREQTVSGYDLTHNKTTRCVMCNMRTHGMRYTPTYQSWRSMNQRCTLKCNKSYPSYGGRGIKICERWRGRGGFAAFLADMGERPSLNHSIGRKNNDLNYTPDNCEWSTREEQDNNTRRSHFITYQGETLTIAQTARKFGLKHYILKNRIRLGWSVEDAITKPVNMNYSRKPKGATQDQGIHDSPCSSA